MSTAKLQPNNWKAIKFKDFVKLQRGFDLPKQNRNDGIYPVIASTSITGYHNEYKVEPPCVTTGRSGALGEVLFVKSKCWPLNTALWVKDYKGNDPYFVYSKLKTLHLEQYNSGAGVPTLNRNHLDQIIVDVPPLADQKQISNRLSTYDDLIYNNTRRIKLLEQMARAIYKESFVTPIENGSLLKGWEVSTLGEHLAELKSGSRPRGGVGELKTGVPSVGAENINGIGRHDYASEKFIEKDFFEGMTRGVVKDRDVAIYKDGAYIGRSSYFRDGFPHKVFSVNEHVFLLRSSGERITQNFLYLWLREPLTIHAIRATNANAAQPGVNQSGIRGIKITLAPKEIVKTFDNKVESILAFIINLAKQNNELRKMRDLLLPKLVTGEIRI